uniref:hypothetical protein n=1 Tax=Trichocoleus desertorum TaxID=1481672 RepID=UPI0025B2DD9D|nr:hypothetical protein [Trichocoleus desertorum]
MSPRRTLICTVTALTSGVFGAYLGGQFGFSAQNRACEARFFGPRLVCKVATAPGAMWKGSFTGLGTGAILGAFLAGVATRKTAKPISTTSLPDKKPVKAKAEAKAASTPPAIASSDPATTAVPAALTSLQAEVLYCLLALLTAKQLSSEAIGDESQSLTTPVASSSLPELRTWAETMARSQSDTYDVTQFPDLQFVTVDEARQLLIEAGFSVQAVDQAWQLIQAAGPIPPLT